ARFVRDTGSAISLYLPVGSADWAPDGKVIRGEVSGAQATLVSITAREPAYFLERSDDGWAEFIPIRDLDTPSNPPLARTMVDCGLVAGLGNRHLLLWFDYRPGGQSVGVWC